MNVFQILIYFILALYYEMLEGIKALLHFVSLLLLLLLLLLLNQILKRWLNWSDVQMFISIEHCTNFRFDLHSFLRIKSYCCQKSDWVLFRLEITFVRLFWSSKSHHLCKLYNSRYDSFLISILIIIDEGKLFFDLQF